MKLKASFEAFPEELAITRPFQLAADPNPPFAVYYKRRCLIECVAWLTSRRTFANVV